MYRRTKILILCILLCFVFTGLCFADSLPNISAKAYIVIDADSGRIIGSKNAQQKLPMASTTKIMTSILAIDTIENLQKDVVIPPYCTDIEGSSLYLKPNQHVKLIDLLYGTMLRSGNDSALAVANCAGGNNIEKFISNMNDKSKELGAFNTHFTNPNGLHDKNHYTTAYDLSLITKYALQNKTFRQIASAKSYKADSLNTVLYNKNKVVHNYKYGTGIKIGYTTDAGRCLVASAEKDNVELIVVLLNDYNWFDDAYQIFDWGFEHYNQYCIVEKDQYMYTDKNGNQLLSDRRFNCILTDDEVENIRFELNKTMPHIAANYEDNIYGYYNIYLNNVKIFTGNCVVKK